MSIEATIAEFIELRIYEETSRRLKADPSRCPMRVLAEVTLEKDPRKQRVELGKHHCKGAPPCPEILERETS